MDLVVQLSVLAFLICLDLSRLILPDVDDVQHRTQFYILVYFQQIQAQTVHPQI